jgi:redox-sensitive bicupin YhaK (pirin superfamily)
MKSTMLRLKSARELCMTEIFPIKPRITALSAGLQVRRLLPSVAARSVGPFIFFDHFGPVDLAAEADSDVGPHPHIGLATVSYLFEGQLLHRDSLGTVQTISPLDINWMTAGHGIVHSERIPDSQKQMARRLHGLQLWVALPEAAQECEPAFQHVAASAIPEIQIGDASVRLLVGSAFGLTSPVDAALPTIYLDVALPAGGQFTLPPLAQELALYSPTAPLTVNGRQLPAQELGILDAGAETVIDAVSDLRLVVIGGERLASPRHMWWNFVSTERDKIEAAAARWEAGEFPPIAGEGELVKMPKWRGRRS